MSKSKVLFIMTGSIACYKACNVISKLVQNNFEVETVLTASAQKFIGAATIEGLTGRTPITDMYEAGNVMGHIHLIRNADLILVAPATANFINKASLGLGDDLASTLFLAHDFKKPFLIAPAMNTSMYLHPTTQASVAKLRSMGIEILEAASGVLACGEVGYGKLLDPELIYQEIQKHLSQKEFKNSPHLVAKSSKPKKVLVTAGGTAESIDAVRFITNLSTGKTGAFIADQLFELGFDVSLVKASFAVKPSGLYDVRTFTDFKSLQDTLKDTLSQESFDAVIHLAAVSDYSVDKINNSPVDSSVKLSSQDDLTLTLKKNPKIISHLKEWSKNKSLQVIGFKLTSTEDAQKKKQSSEQVLKSGADLVVQNDMNDIKKDLRSFKVHSAAQSTEDLTLNELVTHLSQEIQKGVTL